MASILDQDSINNIVQNSNNAKVKLETNYIMMTLSPNMHDLGKKQGLFDYITDILQIDTKDESELEFQQQLIYIRKILKSRFN